MEIIEIGACALDGQFSVIGEFQSFVRPIRNPILTSFCMELTSITQAEVESAPPFPDICPAFREWIQSHPEPVFCSWGGYDKNQLTQDCAHHGVPFPFSEEHINLKVEYAKAVGSKKRFGVGQAMRRAGLVFDGTPHRGIDDARNISRLVPTIYGGA